MSERVEILQDKNTKIVLDLDYLFKHKGEKRARDKFDLRLGQFLVIGGLLMFLFPYIWLFYNGLFLWKELIDPESPILILSYLGILILIYGLYLRRDKNIFDDKLKLSDLNIVRKHIEEGSLKIYDFENALSTEVIEIFDEIYARYKKFFISALSDYMVSISDERELLEKRLGLDLKKFKVRLLNYFQTKTTSFEVVYEEFFRHVYDKVNFIESNLVDEKVILAVLMDNYWKDILDEFEITSADIKGFMLWLKNEQRNKSYKKRWKRLSKLKPKGPINRAYTSRATPTLDEFGTDLTTRVIMNGFTLSIGRESEMKTLLDTLELKSASAAIVIGEPGIGKTYFLEYLASRMVIEDVPDEIKDSRLVSVDLNKVFTKAGSIDQFKQILQKILEEVVYSKNLVIAFEDFSQILSIRTEGKYEVVNTLINMVVKNNIKTITTTTMVDYHQNVKPIKTLASLFNPIVLNEPSPEISMQILLDEAKKLEEDYNLLIQVSAIKRIVEFANEFDYERVMPDKGVRLLQEAVVIAEELNHKDIDENLIDEILSQKLGVKVGDIKKDEAEKLKNIEEEMQKRVVGQDFAIKAISSALRRARSGIVNENRPVASFLFFGPTGVGKTEVAKTLAETYYGDEKNMIRLDMSEYQEESNLDRLIGFSDSSGRFVGGYLTDSVRQRPYSLVLLDEIEKANPKVLDLFLQVLDEGTITDGLGRKIDFTNTIIIATSNVASKEITEYFEKGKKYIDVLTEITPRLKNFFRVEFLNRFDKVIMFRPLSPIDIEQIANLMLLKLRKRLLTKGMDIKWNKNTLLRLTEKGYSRVYGARELRRVIQDTIEDVVATAIIENRLTSGKTVVFDGLDIINIS